VGTSYAYESGKLTHLTRASGTSEKVTWNYIYDEDFPEKIKKIQAPVNYQSLEYEYYPPGDHYYQNSQNKNSQLLQSDGIYTYTWDNNGNLLTKGSTNYTWDYDDRLVGISSPTMDASYVYDYLGNRVRKTVSGTETTYLYNSEDIVKEITGEIDTDYLHGIGIDEPVMMDRSGAEYYYFRDDLGSIREMTDSGGTVHNSYNYGAWGE
jgi:YD repeat-containing protein